MNKTSLALLTYIVAITYFVISERLLYLYTLKYYSLLRYISDDKQSLKELNDHFIKYRLIVRYLRIHVAACSVIISLKILKTMPLLIDIVLISLVVLIIFMFVDFTTLKLRFISLEDKLYRIYNKNQEEN